MPPLPEPWGWLTAGCKGAVGQAHGDAMSSSPLISPQLTLAAVPTLAWSPVTSPLHHQQDEFPAPCQGLAPSQQADGC